MVATPNSLARMLDVCIGELRGHVQDASFIQKSRDVLGELPDRVGLTSVTRDMAILRLSPDCWWIRGAARAVVEVKRALASAIEEGTYSFIILSPGTSSYRLSGSDAAAILARGTAVDLHPDTFDVNHCCRTLHAGVAMTIYRTSAARNSLAYELYVDASLDHYVCTWLEQVGKEYAMRMIP